MSKPQEKRTVPPILANVLATDVYLSNLFVKLFDKMLSHRNFGTFYKMLEISCHGLVWIPCWCLFIWILNNKNLYQMQINLLLGLILDILAIAVVKAIVRRRRPVKENSKMQIGPDKFSFPSGHSSRSFFITYFFMYNWPVHSLFVPLLLCWSISVSISRVLLRRHYLLDVIAGTLLGIFMSCFISLIYLENETCANLILWITDEKSDGGEYHV